MHYSFSSLELFEQCPYAYYLYKIEKKPKEQNAYAQYGTLMHNIIDEWAKGKLLIGELTEVWKARFGDAVTKDFPNLVNNEKEKRFNEGLAYLESFDGFSGYDILHAEKLFTGKISDKKFIGVVDMIAKNRKTGQLVILDHKSKSESGYKQNAKKMYRQLYLYSMFVKEKFGSYPDVLAFNLFRSGKIVERKFNEKKFNEAYDWAKTIIDKIESCDTFDFYETCKDSFYCQNLCDYRKECSS